MTKKRIAILGGGPGGIAAAFDLTSKPEWRDQFEVTVYQLGWRLGGKCASGRGDHERIEEHGLHLLGGSYENAFRMLRSAYDEVGWNWEDHFQGRGNVAMEEQIGGVWEHWPFAFHDKPGTPGDGDSTMPDTIEEMIERLVYWMNRHTQRLDGAHPLSTTPLSPTQVEAAHRATHDLLGAAWDDIKSIISVLTGNSKATHSVAQKIEEFAVYGWEALENFVKAECFEADQTEHQTERCLLALAQGETALLSNWTTQFRRDYVLFMTVATHVIGLTRDFGKILEKGFDVVEDIEYKEWVRFHDPSPSKVAADSAPINAFYELVFAYRDGALKTPIFRRAWACGACGRCASTTKAPSGIKCRAARATSSSGRFIRC